jgi:hypothetical protein
MKSEGVLVGIIHVHSSYSADGRDSLAEIRDFALDRGIRFVGLTDHAEDFDVGRFAAYQRECAQLSDERVILYPGLEFRFAGYTGLHLLALNLRCWIEPATPEAFVSDVTGLCDLTVAAHPIAFHHVIPDAVAERIGAIEVWNAAYNTRYLPDLRAIRLFRSIHSRRPDIVALSGLDQHDASNDRELRITVPNVAGVSPFQLIKEGRHRNVSRRMSFGATIEWGVTQTIFWSVVRALFDRVERLQENLARRRNAKRRQTSA